MFARFRSPPLEIKNITKKQVKKMKLSSSNTMKKDEHLQIPPKTGAQKPSQTPAFF